MVRSMVGESAVVMVSRAIVPPASGFKIMVRIGIRVRQGLG